NLPEVHDLIRQMRSVLNEYDERMMVGEIYLPYDQLVTYYGATFDECHLPFNFHLISSKWQAQTIRNLVESYESALPAGAWPNWVLGNHDQHRIATRIGSDQARVANMLLLTLRGTPTSYYGEEIGMVDGHIPPEFVQDPPAVNQPEIAHIIGRDPERTPMQWDGSAHAGFSGETAVPWLPVADNYKTINVTAQTNNPTSMLNFYCALTALRQAEPALNTGSYRTVDANNGNVFAYVRESLEENGRSFLITLNFSGESQKVNITTHSGTATIVLATDMQRIGELTLANFTLAPNQGLILQLTGQGDRVKG
ncbi:MAG: alpha-glucosidase C-terminal domain-containing protein, partial [Anaerolineales bacterium]|nr:alpha-glucosidase C-terminal domain-containing protein [Anaerolineales bacterium]